MSFIDDSEKNIEFIKETTAAGGVGGFVGRKGRGIDDLFAGPFHPDSGHGSENKQILSWQIDDRKEKRDWMEYEAGPNYTGEPDPVGGYYDADTKNVHDAFVELDDLSLAAKEFNYEYTPEQELEWKSSGWDYGFEKIKPYIENEDFINTSETNMSFINTNMNYDEFDKSMGRDKRNKIFDKDYIEQSKDNVEEKIEEIQLNEDDFLNRSELNLETLYKNEIGLSITIGG